MRFVKSKSDLILKICFSVRELTLLTIFKDFNNLVDIAGKNTYDLSKAKREVTELAVKTAGSKLYEYYTSFLDLYELFEKNCEFCFNLKQSFNPATDKIATIEDLEKYKDDPPDVIVLYKNNYYDFELKRYRGKLEATPLLDFLNKKIIKYYSDHNRNYLIILQPEQYTEFSLDIFQVVNTELIKLKRDLGRIAFSFNNNNKQLFSVWVWPKYELMSRTSVSGSKQILKLINNL